MNKVLLYTLCLISISAQAFAWSPPVGSPMSRSEHPRLLFITDTHRSTVPDAPGYTVSEMRSQMQVAEYATMFSGFISAVDGEYVKDKSQLEKMTVTTNAINFAYLYKLDPDSWVSSGFVFGYTTSEYGAKAKEYGGYIAAQAAAVAPNATLKQNWSDYKTFNYGGGDSDGDGLTNVSLAIVADWCYDLMSLSDKQAYMDGFLNIYNYTTNLGGLGEDVFASAHHYGASQNCGGVFAFYGEDLDTVGTTYQDALVDMGEKLDREWIVAGRDLHNLVYEGGANNVQGPSYGKTAANNMAPFIDIMSSSLNENFFKTIAYWSDMAQYRTWIIKPLDYDSAWHVLLSDDIGDNDQQLNMWYGKNELYWYPAIKHSIGIPATVAKWVKDTLYTDQASTSLLYRGVLSYFFNGIEDIGIQTPTQAGMPLSTMLGMGQYVMRSVWDDTSASLISFYAPKYKANEGGHAHQDFGSFKIFKNGNLTEDRQIAKTYPSAPSAAIKTQKSMFRNTIGVLNPSEVDSDGFNLMGYHFGGDRSAINPADPSYLPGGINYVGVVHGKNLDGDKYDYIDYEYSDAWDDSKVDYAEREFVYSRSSGGANDEYVIVFDRVNAVDSSHQKYYLLQSMFEPVVNNAGTQTPQKYPGAASDDGGRWIFPSSTIDSTVQMVNTHDICNGAMFNRTVLPENFQINKVGGPNHYWEDANGKLINGPSTLTDELKNDYGTYAIQVQPTIDSNYDVFLNVMQIGDSSTLTAMSDIVNIISTTGSTGVLTGAHIKDATKNRIVLFNDQKRATVGKQSAPYVYTAEVTAPSHHLLTNIEPSASFSVSDGSTVVATPTSSSDGVLSFDDSTNTTGSVQYTITKTGGVISIGFSTHDNQTVSDPSFVINGTAVATTGKVITGVTSTGLTVIPVDGSWGDTTEGFTATATLSKGPNSFTFTASEDGGSAQSTINVTYAIAPSGPTVSITTQSQTVSNTTAAINISGTTTDATSVTCDPVTTNDGTVDAFSFDVALNVGANVITVTASDGSTDATDTVTITREDVTPQPTAGTTFKGITLKGVNL